MKSINFKLRLKNGYTATGLLSAFVIFLKEITGAFGLDLSTQIDQYASGVGAILAFLTAIGVIVDGTTKGVSDSGIVQTYNKPRKDVDTPVIYKSETKMKTPQEYDTTQPFSDDSDEIVHDDATGGSSYTEIDASEHDLTNEKALVEGEEDENTSTN